MAKKIVISKSGYNAASETNPNNLIFSSDYNTLKYYASGYVDINYDEDTSGSDVYSTSTAAHGLSYVPFFYAFVDIDSSGTFEPAPDLFGSISTIRYFYVFADSTNIKFVCWIKGSSGSAQTARFRYFIFKNKIDL